MRYNEFEDIFSAKRMQKYVLACGGDTRRAMTLYRYNLKLSQEMFTLISCFEVALRALPIMSPSVLAILLALIQLMLCHTMHV